MPIDTSFLRNAAPPLQAPGPYETFQKSLTLRELIDRRQQNEELRAHQRVQWQQAEEDRARKMSLIDLLRRNPNATEEEILKTDPITGMPLIKERNDQKQVQRQAEEAHLRGEKVKEEILKAKRVWHANLAGSLLQEKDPEKRTELFNRYTGGMVETDLLSPEEASEHMGDEATIWKIIERGLGLEGMQTYRDKDAAAARAAELHRATVAKARADAVHAQQVATGQVPQTEQEKAQLVPGEEREFQAYAPSYYAAKGIKTPTAADEQAARREFVMLKHPPPQPSAGMTPAAEAQQKRITQAGIEARAEAATTKPATGEERKTLAFHLRAQQAEDTVASLETVMGAKGLLTEAWEKHGPEFAQSKEVQAYRQAQRTFTEARLRKESGAAIPEHEYENDRRTYFRQPGDKPETLIKKAAARAAVLRGLAVGSGRAYTEYYGTPPPTSDVPLTPPPPRQGVPKVGGTFNGGKVLKVTKVE